MCVRPSKGKDRLSNGRLLPGSVDLRSAAGRRFSYLVRTYMKELGPEPSESQCGLVRQAATMQLTVERVQADAVAGLKTVDADQLVRLSSELRRLLGALQDHAEQNRPPPGAALAAYLAGRDDE